MRNLLWILLLLLIGCKEKDSLLDAVKPDIVTGRTLMITFAGHVIEQITNDVGTIHHATFTKDRHGNVYQAMQFNRNDSAYIEYAAKSNASFADNIFTFSCWVKLDDTTSTSAILSKREAGGPFEYSIDNHFDHGSFAFDNWIADASQPVYGIDPLNAKAKIVPGEWHHYAWVADGKMLKVYVDGAVQLGVDLKNSGHFFTPSSGRLFIGDGGGFGRHYYFQGAIDEIFMFNRALSDIDLNAVKDYIQ